MWIFWASKGYGVRYLEYEKSYKKGPTMPSGAVARLGRPETGKPSLGVRCFSCPCCGWESDGFGAVLELQGALPAADGRHVQVQEKQTRGTKGT